MKVRNCFVSNSSSSSFIFIGLSVSDIPHNKTNGLEIRKLWNPKACDYENYVGIFWQSDENDMTEVGRNFIPDSIDEFIEKIGYYPKIWSWGVVNED